MKALKKALARFEDEVINQLVALNAVRAADERAARERADGTQGAKAAKGGQKNVDGGAGGDDGDWVARSTSGWCRTREEDDE